MSLSDPSINLLETGALYAILDGAAHGDIAGYAAELAAEGWAAPLVDLAAHPLASADCVPHALRISPRVWRFLKREVWAPGPDAAPPAWGVFFELAQPTPFAEVAAHWRRWLFVEAPLRREAQGALDDATAERVVFRFWDARLVEAFVAACHAEERAAFFGPAARLLLPQADGSVAPLERPNGPVSPATATKEQLFRMQADHMTALELRRLELRSLAFRAYLEKHFESGFAKYGIEDRDAFIRAGLREAAERGFFSERAAAGWLSLQLLHGLDFAGRTSRARQILAEPEHTIGAEDRAGRLIRDGFAAARRIERRGADA